MARRALILACLLLAGCQTAQDRLTAAAVAKAVASAKLDLPDLLPDCTAHIGKVSRKAGDMASHIIRRWEVIADNRNTQADNCAAWWEDYRNRIEGR